MNNPFGGDPPFRPPAPAGESDSQNLVEALLRRQALLLLQQRQQSQSQLSMLGLLSPTPIVFPSPSLLSAEQMLFRQQQEQIWQLQALALAKEREVLVQQQQVLEARQPAPQQTQPSVTTITRVVPKTRIVQSERSTAKLPDKVTTPEEAQKVLTILGTTQRAKSDPFIDASALPYLKVPPSVRGGIVQFFPERLYKLLEDMAAEGKESIVSFLPHGRAFMVYDVDQFVKEILPTYFGGQSKWGSFSRQLNLYGFHRVAAGKDVGAYYHELFISGHPNLCRFMRRVGAPQGMDRRRFKLPEGDDPDFYAMGPVQPGNPDTKPPAYTSKAIKQGQNNEEEPDSNQRRQRSHKAIV